MPKQYHFISGLPRSGSTLLSALLQQNPRFHADISSPVSRLMGSMRDQMCEPRENTRLISDAQRRRLLLGVMDNFYSSDDYLQEIIFDTSRQWCAMMPLLSEFYPQSKIVACVRDLGWIVDSIERIAGRSTLTTSGIFGFKAEGTVYDRVEMLAKGSGMVGYAYNAVKEAFFGSEPGQLMLLRYETLTSDPQQAMRAVYDFIGEPFFEHDYENVSFDADAFDQALGTPGLHHVRKKIEAISHPTVLPPDAFHRFDNDAFWNDPTFNPNNVPII
ncbi:sulfotransferase [Cohaesibacter sp. ES.047]|uniref:sulfotransferase family protein n=1 Tax=Cohaesibacter sp. ES.047 TaxID=1798205 RepID=UPI000BB75364|nr:sulfotransferase [Cohaesibacter sp. ES.047]SNY90424.1 sulfotransferase [Cohaesibacter sp. ES.047]